MASKLIVNFVVTSFSGMEHSRFLPKRLAFLGDKSYNLYSWMNNYWYEQGTNNRLGRGGGGHSVKHTDGRKIVYLPDTCSDKYAVRELHKNNFVTVTTFGNKVSDECIFNFNPVTVIDSKHVKHRCLGLLQYLNQDFTYSSCSVTYPKLNQHIVTGMQINDINDSDMNCYNNLPIGDNKDLALYHLAEKYSVVMQLKQ